MMTSTRHEAVVRQDCGRCGGVQIVNPRATPTVGQSTGKELVVGRGVFVTMLKTGSQPPSSAGTWAAAGGDWINGKLALAPDPASGGRREWRELGRLRSTD
ncbi:uncharacterized protein MAM_04384 [Metarhizium album ARSEF 1941]|uniref:Uncharacterized protein n=1 Tax=Metarhizium album (strain ARSEF 1941) TaxID=1081103 RepID=A0A0B2WYR5_METAS|nr:uncharacterized protein MAM_04384 [Metarhizium album ARSEF 1941]KHN97995.1 hypothetical protein MAM_04384 [Metarhizium album ARSEF 1941]